MSQEINLKILVQQGQEPVYYEILDGIAPGGCQKQISAKPGLDCDLKCKTCFETIKINICWQSLEQEYDNLVKVKIEDHLQEDVEEEQIFTSFDNMFKQEVEPKFITHEFVDPFKENSNVLDDKIIEIPKNTGKKLTVRKQKHSTKHIKKYLSILNLPSNIVLPDLYNVRTPYHAIHFQPDGSKIFVSKTKSKIEILNFDITNHHCDICGKRGRKKRKNLLIEHRKNWHLFPNNSSLCHGCNQEFLTAESKDIHTHFCPKASTIRGNYCVKCDLQSSGYIEHRKHLREIHNSEGISKDFICHMCSECFENKFQLEKHFLDHTQDPKPYKCSHCNACYKVKQYVLNHLVTHHFHN